MFIYIIEIQYIHSDLLHYIQIKDLMNSPLEAQFNEFDTDKDGKIDDTQAY